ncbi:breakpoint cluster region protein-like isoform X1 [Lontra canadensis]|uniref:breakpoint cluster region protein-like isoform X1 n=1 Tax=Lontra canadensis TaxID=76717 RepID=UPI0013F2D948|nr:breakpoint cluster region protein-like isoform X1 [Lontra canadensis]XP_032706696.1 breakpoint cluster region protein-like isoform X1 [Lontra canadensis]
MWDPQDFERHWQAEFPGEKAPVMRLDSVLDMERELERCKLNLKRLQQVLAEEKFKVSYLQAALAAEKRDLCCGRSEGGDGDRPGAWAEEPAPAGPERTPPPREKQGAAGGGGDPAGPWRGDPEAAEKAEAPPYACPDLPTWPGPAGAGGAVRSLTAAIQGQLVQPRLLFRSQEDHAPPGDDDTVPSAQGEELPSGTRAGRGSEEGEPDASVAEDGGNSSDHDFEMVDLNEKFVLGHLLVGPCRLGARDEAEKPARAGSPHRWMHLIPGGRRQQRRSRDLEQLEAEAKDGRSSPLAAEEHPRRGAREHLPPWRRKRFLRVPERDSPSHSSPERGSDCSRNSSDHEDGFSAAPRSCICAARVSLSSLRCTAADPACGRCGELGHPCLWLSSRRSLALVCRSRDRLKGACLELMSHLGAAEKMIVLKISLALGRRRT